MTKLLIEAKNDIRACCRDNEPPIRASVLPFDQPYLLHHCHPERSRGTLRFCSPRIRPTRPNVNRESGHPIKPAPEGRQTIAQDEVQDASPDEVLGKPRKKIQAPQGAHQKRTRSAPHPLSSRAKPRDLAFPRQSTSAIDRPTAPTVIPSAAEGPAVRSRQQHCVKAFSP
jgi:hypothetical protein